MTEHGINIVQNDKCYHNKLSLANLTHRTKTNTCKDETKHSQSNHIKVIYEK